MVQFEFNREDAEAQSNAKETSGDLLAYHCVLGLCGKPGLSIQTVPLLEILDQHHLILLILLLPAHFHFLGNKSIDGLSCVIGLDRQFTVEAAVYQNAERYLGRPAKIEQCIQGGADGAACVQYVIYQHHMPVLYAERNIRCIGDMQAFAHIVAVKSNIEFAVADQGRVYDGLQFVHDPVAEEDTAGLKADDHGICKQQVVFQNLMGQPFYC